MHYEWWWTNAVQTTFIVDIVIDDICDSRLDNTHYGPEINIFTEYVREEYTIN